MPDPVAVFELIGASPLRGRLQAVAARGLTRFVGRQTELEILHQALEKAGAGQGQVVAVIGEPGVGKSRLFYEFLHSHHIHGWLVLESSSVSYGKATPYLPVIDLLKGYFQIEARDEERQIREKVTGKLLTLDIALQPTLPAFLSLLDVPVEDAHWEQLDPPQRRQRMMEACKRLLLRESQGQPLLLVFENLHWIDTETQVLLDSLIESLPTAHTLLLVNYRPEYHHGWGSKTSYTQLRLDPLPPASTEELLQDLLGDDTSLIPLKRLLIERTEGNPFFLEESVRMLVETEMLIGERGAYRLTTPLQSIQVPATVQAVLAARIDRLPPKEKQLLQAAAVIGKDIPFLLLQAIAEMSAEELRRGLTHLQTAEFLYETTVFPDLEYTFKHALTQQVAYESLLQERRRVLHAHSMEVLEALAGDRLTEQIETLAYHALRGQVWPKAFLYLRQAGAKADTRSANREAVIYFEQALMTLKNLPESRETLEQAFDLRIDLCRVLFRLGELRRVFDYLCEAISLAQRLDDQRRLGRVYASMSNTLCLLGDQEQAIDYGQRALAIAGTLGDISLQGSASSRMGHSYYTLGDYRQAIDYLRRSIVALEGELTHSRGGLPHQWLTWCLAELGAFDESIMKGEEAVQLAERINHPFILVNAYFGVCGAYLCKGNLHKAIPMLERGVELCHVSNNWLPLALITSQLGYAYALSGRVSEALPLLEQAIERATSMSSKRGHSLKVAWLSEGYLFANRRDDALEHALHALELSQAHKERGNQAYALRLLGEIYSHHDPPQTEQAADHYHQALTLATELGMRPLQAHCHRGLGTLYAKTGQKEHARAELATAIDLYRSMEMTFWLPQTEEVLAQVEER